MQQHKHIPVVTHPGSCEACLVLIVDALVLALVNALVLVLVNALVLVLVNGLAINAMPLSSCCVKTNLKC
jgi:hypothetical protein